MDDALSLLQSKKNFYLFEPYAKKEAQHHTGLFGNGRQYVPHLDILFDRSADIVKGQMDLKIVCLSKYIFEWVNGN